MKRHGIPHSDRIETLASAFGLSRYGPNGVSFPRPVVVHGFAFQDAMSSVMDRGTDCLLQQIESVGILNCCQRARQEHIHMQPELLLGERHGRDGGDKRAEALQ